MTEHQPAQQDHQPDTARSAGRGQVFQHTRLAQHTLTVASIITLVVVLLLFLWVAADVLLLAFTGVLLAIVLRTASDWLSQRTGLHPNLSLALSTALLTALFGTGIWLLAPQIAEQIDQLTEQIPRTFRRLEGWATQYGWIQQLVDQARATSTLFPAGSEVVQRVTGVFSSTIGAIAGMAIILFVGLYLAVNPRLYIEGALCLVPRAQRTRAHEVVMVVGTTLRWWLLGKVLAMVVIGVLTTIGLWALGVPLALVLGLIAALLSFIPNIGPTLALVPALLIALTQSPIQALYVLILYMSIQAGESYILTPLVEQQTVRLPPALTLLVQALMAILFGVLGVFLAAPLTAVALVLVKLLYLEDLLDESIDVRGKEAARREANAVQQGTSREAHSRH